jgi:hypothetical protein
MPEPTAAELAKEAEQEAAVFSQAVNVEKLLNMLRALDPAKDNLADNEEIQVRILAIIYFSVIADYYFNRNCIDQVWLCVQRSLNLSISTARSEVRMSSLSRHLILKF